MQALYNLFIHLYGWAAAIAACFDSKARSWHRGRKDLVKRIIYETRETENIIWVHCASLGEFEQGKPIIEYIKKEYPKYKILITFFSPSGYEIRKNYPLADFVYYLPADKPGNAKAIVRSLNPALAIFVKYEFWFNYFQELNNNDIPLILISASFRPEQRFFKCYGGWFRKKLNLVNKIFVQEKESLDLLENIYYNRASVSGDTRFDRVMDTAEKAEEIELVKRFVNGKKTLIAGSTWPKDEELLTSWIKSTDKDKKIIIAPHQVNDSHIAQILKNLDEPAVLYTQADHSKLITNRIMVIDTIGILSRIYKYAYVAYVGGAFGTGLHNILEPAAFGIPVVFGPDHKKFREAGKLIDAGGGFSISSKTELNNILKKLFDDKSYYHNTCEVTSQFMKNNRGATALIAREIDKTLKKE